MKKNRPPDGRIFRPAMGDRPMVSDLYFNGGLTADFALAATITAIAAVSALSHGAGDVADDQWNYERHKYPSFQEQYTRRRPFVCADM